MRAFGMTHVRGDCCDGRIFHVIIEYVKEEKRAPVAGEC